MDWHTRITQARAAKNLNKSELAKLVGVSPATITMWESGQTKKIEGANLMKVCNVLDINPMWLMGKLDVEGRRATGLANAVSTMGSFGLEILAIDVVKIHSDEGSPYFEIEPEFELRKPSKLGVRRQWLEKNNLDWKSLVAMKIDDVSMEPTLYHGDFIVIDKSDTEPVDGAVFVLNYEYGILIRRLVRDAGQWWLISDHSDQRRYGRKVYTGDEGEVLGRVVLRETEHI